MAKPVIEIRNVSKRFSGTQALNDVSLALYPGEIHSLLGENGAGKSTLIKIMTGIHQPDSGEIILDDHPIHIENSMRAQAYGIAAVYQEPMIFPDLNVAENIFMSHNNRGAIVNWRRMYREAEDLLAKLGVKLDVHKQARGLTLASQQSVEIAKAISLNVRVLIMDEPTASLSAHEVHQLHQLIFTLRERGVAILYVSHRMEEVFEISDRITVLRDGKLISSAPRAEVTPESAIREMVGRKVEEFFAHEEREKGKLLLSVRNLQKDRVFTAINFDVHHGEVLGFAGLIGARRTDIGLALFGIEPADSGEIMLDGQAQTIRSAELAMRRGIAYVTEDRRQLGLVMPLSITANISLPMLPKYMSNLGLINIRAEHQTAVEYRDRLSIRSPSVALHADKLSGGNQQKVVLSKWLNTNPRLLILDEPTRGIDVGAKAEVHHIINNLAAQGLAIILISSDLPEVLAMSDRILVMREGRQMGIFNREEFTQERIMSAAMGQLEGVKFA